MVEDIITWDEGMLNRVLDYIKENNLIEDGDKIVIGVSGGADSICLLHVLKEIYSHKPVELCVVHIHHGIRGEAADRDEAFVRTLAEKLSLRFFSFRFNIPEIAKEEGMSEEEAGREIRYRTFLDVCNTYGCNKIAIAHNRNDNAETVLFHLFRGSSIRGLSGIEPSRRLETEQGGATIIRPLLFAYREEIEAYLRMSKIEHCTDESNFSELYIRNKLRNKVLPYVTTEINSGAVEHIAMAAEELKEAKAFIDNQIMLCFTKLVTVHEVEGSTVYELDLEAVNREDTVIKKGILMKILEMLTGSRKDIGRVHILMLLELFDKQVGKQLMLPDGIMAERGYTTVRIFLRERKSSEFDSTTTPFVPVKLSIPGSVTPASVDKVLEAGVIPYEKGLTFPKNSCTKWFDYDKIENTLELRTRKEGDYLQIDSRGGTKKLKDYFIDRKLPREQRDAMLLIADGSHILWILGDGNRMSEGYKISEKTHRILWINIIDTEEKKDGR